MRDDLTFSWPIMIDRKGPLGPPSSKAVAVTRGLSSSSSPFTFMNIGGSPLSFSFSHSHLYYTLSSLLAFIILSLAYSRFRGLFGPENKNMSLNVKWGRERFVPSLLFFPPLTGP